VIYFITVLNISGDKMKTSNRRFIVKAAAAGILGRLAPTAGAQEVWQPSKPIKMVLGYPPGGAADITARDLAPELERYLGQPIIMDYRPGAGAAIGAEVVAGAQPDGYTIGLIDVGPLTIAPHARKLRYDPLDSFTYIATVALTPMVILVHPDLPVKTLQELLDYLKARPGRVSFSTSGLGTIHQMSAELLKASTRTFMVHIPYRGGGPAMTDLISGTVQVSFASMASAIPVVQAGRARAIAVTSAAAVPALAGVRSVAAQGVPGYEAAGWFVLAGPKSLPPPVVTRWNQAMNAALASTAIAQRFQAQGSIVKSSTPSDALQLVYSDFGKWKRIIRQQDLKFE
jgi:tripartite-type tricarboxylate transporter receptor subunit TctC